MTVHDSGLSRRTLLKAGAAFAIGVYIAPNNGPARAQAAPDPKAVNIAPNTFLVIGADDTVTVLSKHIEMGQGPFTGMATLVAEELDADWAQMRADLMQLPVETLTASDASATGAAVLAAVTAGIYTHVAAAVAALKLRPEVIEPDAGKAAVYDESYRRYREVFAALEPAWH